MVQLGDGAANTRGLKTGERVIAEQIVPCWKCRYCQRGQYWMCQVHNIFGFQNEVNGGWAEYMKFPAQALIHKIPHEIPTNLVVLVNR